MHNIDEMGRRYNNMKEIRIDDISRARRFYHEEY